MNPAPFGMDDAIRTAVLEAQRSMSSMPKATRKAMRKEIRKAIMRDLQRRAITGEPRRVLGREL